MGRARKSELWKLSRATSLLDWLIKDEFVGHLTQLDGGKSQLEGFSRTLTGSLLGLRISWFWVVLGLGLPDKTVSDFERLRTMVKTQHETWEVYEASDPGFNQVKEVIAEINSILSNVGNLTVG